LGSRFKTKIQRENPSSNFFTDVSGLDDSQKLSIELAVSGANVFISGGAGTGKTFVISKIKSELAARGIYVAVTSSTGLSALNIGIPATTLHQFVGIGIAESRQGPEGYLRHMKDEQKRRLMTVKCLIIDEISMIQPAYLDTVSDLLSALMKTPKPMGGMQVIFTGDFAQLPYVRRGLSSRTPREYLFEKALWDRLKIETVLLKTTYRQASDASFSLMLNRLRLGEHTDQDLTTILSRAIKPEESTLLTPETKTSKVYCYRKDVENFNKTMLSQIKSDTYVYPAKIEKSGRYLNWSDFPTEETLELKVGALVILLVNLDVRSGLVNGSKGTVTRLGKDEVTVLFSCGIEKTMEAYEWKKTDANGAVQGRFSQYPIKLAWALTVHKCQGMTLEKTEIHTVKCFEEGQFYTAISRVKSLEELKIVGFSNKSITFNKKVGEFYKKHERRNNSDIRTEHNLKFI